MRGTDHHVSSKAVFLPSSIIDWPYLQDVLLTKDRCAFTVTFLSRFLEPVSKPVTVREAIMDLKVKWEGLMRRKCGVLKTQANVYCFFLTSPYSPSQTKGNPSTNHRLFRTASIPFFFAKSQIFNRPCSLKSRFFMFGASCAGALETRLATITGSVSRMIPSSTISSAASVTRSYDSRIVRRDVAFL